MDDVDTMAALVIRERGGPVKSPDDAIWKTVIDRIGLRKALLVAIRTKSMIARCKFNEVYKTHEEYRYRLGGVWHEPKFAWYIPSELKQLQTYDNISDGTCPDCTAKMREQMSQRRQERARPTVNT